MKSSLTPEQWGALYKGVYPTPYFKMWVRGARLTRGPMADLIRDMRRDRDLPGTMHSLPQLRAYLHSKDACPGAIDAAQQAWDRYKNWLKHSPVARRGKSMEH